MSATGPVAKSAAIGGKIGDRLPYCRAKGGHVDRRALDAWVAGCVRAWETNDPDEIGRLFTDDALY